jgi:protein phosphatase
MSANSRIIDEHLKYCICGTTGTLLCIFQDKFKIYHMGDSRAYLLRNKDLFLLTKDQTLAEMKMTLGFYKKNDPLIEKEKHQLIEYIGCDWAKEGLKPEESKWEDLEDGDRVLLCSDGLYDMCSDLMISDILVNNNQVEIAVQKLIDTSIKNGGKDNVTCLLVEYNF